jgi:predicted XRE-type DNA-binding protein
MKNKEKIHSVSDNIFKDIGLVHPDRMLARAEIMLKIAEIIKARGLTQKEASKILGLPQSKVSCLLSGKLSMFSLDHLFQLLNMLDEDVEIIIKPKTRKEKFAATHVMLAPAL